MFQYRPRNPGTRSRHGDPSGQISGSIDPERCVSRRNDRRLQQLAGGTTLGLFGKILGLDLLGTLDLLENDGVVTTLAEPNLTALSGETASFLAGGEFPIPVSQSLGAVTIEYKQYGVGLAFTPIVLADGRISMRVRPEVSQLSDAGSVTLNGYIVPALTTRRAETTVELGSGQSFMIAGSASEQQHEQHRESAVPRRRPGAGRAVPLDQVPAQRDRASHHRDSVSGAAGLRVSWLRRSTDIVRRTTSSAISSARASPARAAQFSRQRSRPLQRRHRRQRPAAAPGVQAVIRGLTGKDWTMRSKVILIALASSVAACNTPDLPDKGVASVNVPVVTSADYVFDAAAPDGALAPGESERLNGWFQGLGLGYGDSIYVDGALLRMQRAARSPRLPASMACSFRLARPVTSGGVQPGMVRVVVSRRRAEVPDCPNWSRPVAAQLRQSQHVELRLRRELQHRCNGRRSRGSDPRTGRQRCGRCDDQQPRRS